LNLEYAINRKELSKGTNGVVYEIEYERLKYKAYTILKVSQNVYADNLIYEYIVGLFINTVYKKYPCFLETYGFFKSSHNINSIFENINSKQELNNIINESCRSPMDFGIQIEYLKNPSTLEEKIKLIMFWRKAAITSLFQVYFVLNEMKDIFTHYDLHASNVLLYEPIADNYIEYNYHLNNGEVVKFKTNYIIKIIDYGRCYFNNKGSNSGLNIDSVDIRNMVCVERECNIKPNKCGYDLGYGWLDNPKGLSKKNYYINSSRLNRSHDLRLLKIVSDEYSTIESRLGYDFDVSGEINKLFNSIVYTGDYGTNQLIRSGLPNKINNIMDAFKSLKNICLDRDFINSNNNYFSDPDKKIGDLHIYGDGSNRDMVFKPFKN